MTTTTSSSHSSSSTHAYAIISTSSALLSRSNSSNSSLNRHSFSPAHDYRRHRQSKSLALPTPPSTLRARQLRAHTCSDLSSSSSLSSETSSELDEAHHATIPFDHPSVPNNPELWDPSQLSAYLHSRNLSSLGELVLAHKLDGMNFMKPSVVQESTLPPEAIPILARESRKLRFLRLSRNSNTSQASSMLSDESSTDESYTPNRVSRHRVKSMVAAIESIPFPQDPELSKFIVSDGLIHAKSDCETKFTPEQNSPRGLDLNIMDRPQDKDASEGTSMMSPVVDDQVPIYGAQAWESNIITATAKKIGTPKNENLRDRAFRPSVADLFPHAEVNKKGQNNPGFISIPTQADTEHDSHSTQIIESLKDRIGELEDKIRFLEERKGDNVVEPGALEADDHDLPQYLFMATVGVCALIGQSIIRRFWANS